MTSSGAVIPILTCPPLISKTVILISSPMYIDSSAFRKAEESMYIGDDIKITVLDIRGGQVRIGITAPDDVKIHREEVYNRISSED